MTGKGKLCSEHLTVLGGLSSSGLLRRRRNFRKLSALLITVAVLETIGLRMFGATIPQPKTNAPPATTTNLTAIPSSEIPARAESTLGETRAIEAQARTDAGIMAIDQQLTNVTGEIAARSDEDSRILSHSTSLDLFARLQASWDQISQRLSAWNKTLGRRAKQLQESDTHLDQLEKTWNATRESAQKENVPSELFDRVDSVLTEIKHTREQVQAQLALVLKVQNRVTEQDARVRNSLTTLDEAHHQIFRNLLVKDSPVLWSGELRSKALLGFATQDTLGRQWEELSDYWEEKRELFVLQALIFAGLAAALIVARRKLQRLCRSQPGLSKTAQTLGAPVSSALVLTLLLSPWLYPQAPRLLWSILGVLILVPLAMVLRRLLKRQWFEILNALLAFYLFDQIRNLFSSQPLLWRLLFLVEIISALIYCAYLVRASRKGAFEESKFSKPLRFGIRIALVLLTAILVANVFGFVRLSGLVGNLLLSTAYLALILYAVISLANALVEVALTVSPLAHLGLLKRNSALLAHRFERTFQWLGVLVWLLFILRKLAARRPVFQAISEIAKTRVSIGSVGFKLGNIVQFCLVLWASALVSRFLRFVLEEEVYPRVQLGHGVHYSISRTLHYAILFLGFLLALAVIGVDLTKVTVLAGAFGVGLGFGMQNIVNNFISGIILLFERPVKVGDVIQLGDNTEGVVNRIGIRASVIRTSVGSEIIIPNAKLIADTVTNWTLSQRRRMISLPVAVASDAEPRKVIQLLKDVASGLPQVAKERPVDALLTDVKSGATNFEVRAWVDKPETWQQARSDLYISIQSALASEHIAMK
jgi:small-conductance mechanosensitive channel